MGERELTKSALRMFIENARLDPGVSEPMQKEMGFRQVGRGTQTPHGYRLAAGSAQ